MPGAYVIKPIEANLTKSTDILTKMSPYCAISINNTNVKGQPSKDGGKHPHWDDTITLPPTNESKVLLKLMDKDKFSKDDVIGSCLLNLQEVHTSGQVRKWYPLYDDKSKPTGEILLEAVFQPQGTTGVGVGMDARLAQSQVYEQSSQYATPSGQGQYYGDQRLSTASIDSSTIRRSNVWTEQRQVVESHTFVKEVEVVETRPVLQDIEVMEPVKVLKDVQYTQAVPVKMQIETVEPYVIMKEVEVIEPRVVIKTIQVVENVPVKRQVEVIEMRNSVKQVETFEPQTFTKQVEVTEFHPVRRQVEVTQPVTLKKTVEYVEPVITTQTITKESYEPMVIDQKITTEVGPASVIGMSAEYGYYQQYGEITLEERQRLAGHSRWVGYETIFAGLNDQERLWEQRRLSQLSEQEWIRERERLKALKEQDRLYDQRGFFTKLTDAFKKINFGGKSSTQAGQTIGSNITTQPLSTQPNYSI